MSEDAKVVDVYADWDDPYAFRVFLAYETGDGDIDYRPMRAEHFGDSVAVRLYRAVMRDCARDLAKRTVSNEPLGWPTEAPAKRVAKAVKEELARIEKGEPGPSDMAIQMALAMLPKRARR